LQIPFGIFLKSAEVFILVFIRMTGLFVAAPIFGRRNIPSYFKIGFAFMTALILANIVSVPEEGIGQNIYDIAFIIIKEFVTGLTIGYVAYLIFTSIYLAGQLVDMQIGFGMVNVIDPTSNIQVPVTANFYFILSMLVFLMVNGHHYLIRALYDSFVQIPIGRAHFGSEALNIIVSVFGSVFVIAFKIAAPVTAAVILADVALGIMSRPGAPQQGNYFSPFAHAGFCGS
jgi:flagellar biosynthetic protein FliR